MNKYLIDTHILLWSLFKPEKLCNKIKNVLENNDLEKYVCSISFWEISLKFSLGKLELINTEPDEIYTQTMKSGFYISEISPEEYSTSYKLPFIAKHKDPFDRILIWHSIINKMTVISADNRFSEYKKSGHPASDALCYYCSESSDQALISIRFGLASSRRGMVTSSSPFSSTAETFSLSYSFESWKAR